MSTQYTALVPILIAECENAACNASVLALLTPADWQCYFQSTAVRSSERTSATSPIPATPATDARRSRHW
jgi:hypothetical protein